jgi:hypothetical protein
MPDLNPPPEIKLRGKTYKLPEMELKEVIPVQGRILALRKVEHLSEGWLSGMFDIAFVTLTFVDPGITREEFDRSPPSYRELIAAFPIIMEQSRFVERGTAEKTENKQTLRVDNGGQ